MIRTRDLVLFLVCLVFLGVLIVSTVFTDDSTPVLTVTDWEVSIDEVLALGGESTATTPMDRTANIARLREKIAANTSSITPQPDTFVEDVIISEVDASNPADSAAPGVRSCLYLDDVLPKLANWPLSGVRVQVIGGARTVSYSEALTIESATDAAATSTTAVTETITNTIASLPLFPTKSPTPSCVPSEVIGVTSGGTMMFNTDASIWLNVDQNTLVGYARDGYPIYGRYDGELDVCGGYDHPAGYRYSVSSDRSYIIGCFTATPQSFNL